MKDPVFTWDKENGIATCIIFYKNKEYIGKAKCSVNDKDMMSQKVGEQIALNRAEIRYFKHIRDNELKPSISALSHCISTIKCNPNFNNSSFEYKRLEKELNNLKSQLLAVNNYISLKREELNNYISSKENLYKKLREKRNKDKNK